MPTVLVVPNRLNGFTTLKSLIKLVLLLGNLSTMLPTISKQLATKDLLKSEPNFAFESNDYRKREQFGFLGEAHAQPAVSGRN